MGRDYSRSDHDELDELDPAPRPRPSAKRPPQGRAKVLPRAEANGTVVELFPNQSAVKLDGAGAPVLCGYKMATLASRGASRERSPVCVGDRVRVEQRVITGRCERLNCLARRAPDSRNALIHAIVANIDLLVVVAAAAEPEFSAGIVDRFAAAALAQKIPVLLCVNKTDLLAPGAPRPWLAQAPQGARVIECSARSGEGASALAALVRGKTAAFCGHSGVGKTSLLRRLLGDEELGRVAAISAASGKGRHTTTGAVLLPGPEGSFWIDTPGIMNFAAP